MFRKFILSLDRKSDENDGNDDDMKSGRMKIIIICTLCILFSPDLQMILMLLFFFERKKFSHLFKS